MQVKLMLPGGFRLLDVKDVIFSFNKDGDPIAIIDEGSNDQKIILIETKAYVVNDFGDTIDSFPNKSNSQR